MLICKTTAVMCLVAMLTPTAYSIEPTIAEPVPTSVPTDPSIRYYVCGNGTVVTSPTACRREG